MNKEQLYAAPLQIVGVMIVSSVVLSAMFAATWGPFIPTKGDKPCRILEH